MIARSRLRNSVFAWVLLFTIVTSLFVIGLPIRPVQGVSFPSLPQGFHGTVSINGGPAPIGTEIKVTGAGVNLGTEYGNPVTTTVAGQYGTPELLLVQGDIPSGTPLTFFVNEVNTGISVTWESGQISEVNLDVTLPEETPPGAGGDGDGGGLIPSLPHAFYGMLTINGALAPAGTEVEARGDGVAFGPENPLITTVAGYYGGASAKLVVQGEIIEGTILSFFINDTDTGQSAEWHAGEMSELNLQITIPVPPDSGGGGGGGIPSLPHAFYGLLTVDGSAAPPGTQIEARGEGVINVLGNPVVITLAGVYGGASSPETMLIVQGDIADGAELTFFIDGYETGLTAEWHAGEVSNLDLAVTIPAPPSVPTGGGGGGVAGAIPALPQAFYGTVVIDGEPAPQGTIVEAKGEGVVVGPSNPLTTTEPGLFGGEGVTNPKLVVQGDIVEGTPLAFFVNGMDTGVTAEWNSGEITELDLEIITPDSFNILGLLLELDAVIQGWFGYQSESVREQFTSQVLLLIRR